MTNSVFRVDIWRHLVNFWTLVIYGVIVYDFFNSNSLSYIIGPVSAIYIAVLAVYTAQKEFERWHDFNLGIHPGEFYVYAWTVLVVILFTLEFFNHGVYEMPNEVFTTYIVVIGVLAITKKSKANYLEKKKKR